MQDNDLWDLVELQDDFKPIGYKWIYNTKGDHRGNIELLKDGLVAKEFTLREGLT